MSTLPGWLWAAGANHVGSHSRYDKTRCTNCGRWTRIPVEYELDRILCGPCQNIRVAEARDWLKDPQKQPTMGE